MDLAKKLKRLREDANLSQKDLAERIGITAQSYNNYEKRDYKPSPEMLVKLAIALNTDINELLDFTPDALAEAKRIAREVGIEYHDDGNGYITIKRNVIGVVPAVAGAMPSNVTHIKADYKSFIEFILNACKKADADLKSLRNRLILFYVQGFQPPKPSVSAHTPISSRFTYTYSPHTHAISSSTTPHSFTGSMPSSTTHWDADEEDD